MFCVTILAAYMSIRSRATTYRLLDSFLLPNEQMVTVLRETHDFPRRTIPQHVYEAG